MLDPFPIWDDITTFDGRPWQGRVDVVSGGFPCQDISSAGRGAGLDGARSGLWFEMLRVIGEVQPAYVFAENSPNLRTRGLGRVLDGLAGLGFNACWGVLGAWHVGAPHRRNRMWIVAAHPDRCRERGLAEHAEMASTSSTTDIAGDAHSKRERRPQHKQTERAGDTRHATDVHGAGLAQREGERSDARAKLVPAERVGASVRGDWWGVRRFAGVDDGMASRLVEHRASTVGEYE